MLLEHEDYHVAIYIPCYRHTNSNGFAAVRHLLAAVLGEAY